MRNQTIIYSEDDSVKMYITALQNGQSETLVDLFRKEVGEPRMLETSEQSGFSPKIIIQSVVGSESSNVLVTLMSKYGNLVIIPFYKSEWLFLFARLRERRLLTAA